MGKASLRVRAILACRPAGYHQLVVGADLGQETRDGILNAGVGDVVVVEDPAFGSYVFFWLRAEDLDTLSLGASEILGEFPEDNEENPSPVRERGEGDGN